MVNFEWKLCMLFFMTFENVWKRVIFLITPTMCEHFITKEVYVKEYKLDAELILI